MAHRLTIARSKKIDGPYVSNPANPLLTNCSMAGQGMQIQGTGHGDFVQAKDGSWWVVFLAYRNFGGSYHHIGRETYLAPMTWEKNKWPVINGGNPIDTLMQVKGIAAKEVKATTTGQHDWIYIQNPIAANYQRVGEGFRLRGHSSLTENNQPTFLGRRQESERFTMETEIDTEKMGFGCKAGLTVYQINEGHMEVSVEKYMTGTVCVVADHTVKSINGQQMAQIAQGSKVKLRIASDGNHYRFEYSLDGTHYETLAQHNCSLLSTEVVGGFTGAVVGMYVEGEESADFGYFKYTEK